MRWRALILIAALAGCSESVDSFHLYDSDGRVRTAHVEICGSDTPMLQHGNYFFAGVPITCEGSGNIHLVFENGSRADCAIGYVTGIPQQWYFRTDSGDCKPRELHG